LSALGLGGCVSTKAPAQQLAPSGRLALTPILARTDRIFDVTVCLRPFRAAGPRMDAEQVGDAFVVHNYGHGGSGWSLSWGSGTLAVQKAMTRSPAKIAVLGCGALGLTAAILAQQAGAKVTIYAREFLPDTRSFRATGSWTPDSRIALTSKTAPGFPALWEEMARTSFKTYRRFLGLPGTPVEWIDNFILSDDRPRPPQPAAAEALDFAFYRDRIGDLTPRSELLPPGSTPFPAAAVRRRETMIFNIAGLSHTLMSDFLAAGGRMVRAEFHSPAELAQLEEKVVINCSGYGARALWKDESVVPVRGQIAWLIPQPEARYGLSYRDVNVLSRRDGVVVQAVDGGDMKGYGETDETPDRAAAEASVKVIAELYARMG
jgi:D-amino-acid oxidase